jgi:hypothetical protein
MASTIKLLGSQTDLTSATTVGSATVVRVLATAAGTVTQKSAGGATVGTIQMLVNTEIVLSKAPDNTLEGGAGFKVVKVAYSN